MSRRGYLFIRKVNLAIVGLVAVTVAGVGAHYVAVEHEIHRIRLELCSAKLEAITARHPYLSRAMTEPADKCATLSTLTGEQVMSPTLSMRWREHTWNGFASSLRQHPHCFSS